LVDGAGAAVRIGRQAGAPDERDNPSGAPKDPSRPHVASAAEQAQAVERLVSLGAERVDWDHYPEDPDFVVLADPEGNRFCVVDLSHEHT